MIEYRNSIPNNRPLLALVVGAVVLSGALAFIPSILGQQANAVPILLHGMGAQKGNTPGTIVAGGSASSQAATTYADDASDSIKVLIAKDGVNFSGGAASLTRSGTDIVADAGTTMFAVDVAPHAGTNAICTPDGSKSTGYTFPCLIGVAGNTYTDGTLTLKGNATVGRLDFNVTVTYPNAGSIHDQVRYVWVDQCNGTPDVTCSNNPQDSSAGATETVNPVQPVISTLINNDKAEITINIGDSVTDTAILSGTISPGTGTIFFAAFDNSDCTGTPVFTDSKAASGDNSYTSKSFTPANIGTYYFVANYTSNNANNKNAVSACGDEVLTVQGQASTMLQKTANVTSGLLTDSVTQVAVRYTFTETNDGDLNLTSVAITDSNPDCSPAYVSGDSNSDGKLNPGESWVYTCDVVFTSQGTYTNTANATGTITDAGALDGTLVNQDTDEDEQATFTVHIYYASTMLTKSANVTSGAAPLAVRYTFTETNDGNVNLTSVAITDSNPDCSPAYVSGDSNSDGKLNPGESWVYTCDVVLNASSTNNANATGTVADTGTAADGVVINQNNDKDEHAQATVTVTGFEGCTPGFWKNNADKKGGNAWVPTGYSPKQTVGSVFSSAPASLSGDTLLKALSYQGGNTLTGAKQILLRAAVAGLLNSAYPGAHYPISTASLISQVNAALASNDRNAILTLASTIDADNNLGCFLDQQGRFIG